MVEVAVMVLAGMARDESIAPTETGRGGKAPDETGHGGRAGIGMFRDGRHPVLKEGAATELLKVADTDHLARYDEKRKRGDHDRTRVWRSGWHTIAVNTGRIFSPPTKC
jgi:hypothetical protein